MSVTAEYNLRLNVVETQSMGDVPGSVAFTHNTATAGTLNASSTVPATKVWTDTRLVPADPFTETLDLTALTPGPLGTTVDFTGLKVQAVKITCPATNTGTIAFEDGALTPYNFFASAADAGGKVRLSKGMGVMILGGDQLLDVAAGAKDILVTGTVASDVYTIEIVAG